MALWVRSHFCFQAKIVVFAVEEGYIKLPRKDR